jgi:hypothetical protein
LISVKSSALLASVLTLLAVDTIGTVTAEHGIITDSALLFAYISLNIWLISFEWKRSVTPIGAARHFIPLLSTFSAFNLYSSISASMKLFSEEIIFILLYRMLIFGAHATLIDESGDKVAICKLI